MRPTVRGGIIRLPSMDVVSAPQPQPSACHQQAYRDSGRRRFNQKSYAPSRGFNRRYSGPSSSAGYHQQDTSTVARYQRSDEENFSHNNDGGGAGNRSRSGSVVSMSRDNNSCVQTTYGSYKNQCEVNQGEITIRPRRSASVHVEIVDEEGFTLVTHGRRGGGSGMRGGDGYRLRGGSSGDSTGSSHAKYFYGSDSNQQRDGSGRNGPRARFRARDVGRVSPF